MEHIFETKEFIMPVSIDELAEILKVARITVDRLVRAKKISYLRVGASYRFTKEQIDEFIENNTTSMKTKSNDGEKN